MARPEDIIGQSVARLNEATASAREVLAELRGTAKDLKQTIRDGKQLITDIQFLSAHLAEREVGAEVKKQIDQALEELGEATKVQMDKSVAKVIAEFDKLTNILMGRDQKGQTPIDEIILNNINRGLGRY